MEYADGASFVGHWENDERARGTFKFGKVTYTPLGDGDNFKNELMHGKGKLRWGSGANYSGDWVNGKRTGEGTMIYKDKSNFTGTWVDGRKVKGKMTWPNNSSFEGNYASGKGKYTWPSGNYYTGDWVG